jgi:hypothetical protein
MRLNFKLWHLRLDDKEVPEDVTHVIVDDSVTTIKEETFRDCKFLVSISMGDNVKRIEQLAFCDCRFLRFIRLSETLEYIGWCAFAGCRSLEALFLPPTLKYIGREAFWYCRSLRLLVLPNDISLSNIGKWIIRDTYICQIARAGGVEYEYNGDVSIINESVRQFHEWLIHDMEETPFHKLCCDSFVTTKEINDYLNENGNDSALQIDKIHGMTPLHMLAMNPYASADCIASLFNSNMEAVFCLDNKERTPIDYARDNNVRGFIAMSTGMCIHRNSLRSVSQSEY